MNTKVKIGIASAIVAALIGLIVLDQKTGAKPEAAGNNATAADSGGALHRSGPLPAARSIEAEADVILDSLQRPARAITQTPSPETPKPPIKVGDQTTPGKQIPSKESADEYVIQQGDTYEAIAEKKFGDRNAWPRIAEANPGVKPSALRVGRKITVPSRAEAKPAETAVVAEPPLASPATAPKTYTVQPGDTLTGISKKLFNTVRHHEKIFEANRDTLENPNDLQAGMKLAVPEVNVARTAAPAPETLAPIGPVPVGPIALAPPVAGKMHKVQPNDKLWTIAEKYCGDKGVIDMMKAIIAANSEKLRNGDRSLLSIGWELIIPE